MSWPVNGAYGARVRTAEPFCQSSPWIAVAVPQRRTRRLQRAGVRREADGAVRGARVEERLVQRARGSRHRYRHVQVRVKRLEVAGNFVVVLLIVENRIFPTGQGACGRECIVVPIGRVGIVFDIRGLKKLHILAGKPIIVISRLCTKPPIKLFVSQGSFSRTGAQTCLDLDW